MKTGDYRTAEFLVEIFDFLVEKLKSLVEKFEFLVEIFANPIGARKNPVPTFLCTNTLTHSEHGLH